MLLKKKRTSWIVSNIARTQKCIQWPTHPQFDKHFGQRLIISSCLVTCGCYSFQVVITRRGRSLDEFVCASGTLVLWPLLMVFYIRLHTWARFIRICKWWRHCHRVFSLHLKAEDNTRVWWHACPFFVDLFTSYGVYGPCDFISLFFCYCGSGWAIV